jgi:hypothetical protein
MSRTDSEVRNSIVPLVGRQRLLEKPSTGFGRPVLHIRFTSRKALPPMMNPRGVMPRGQNWMPPHRVLPKVAGYAYQIEPGSSIFVSTCSSQIQDLEAKGITTALSAE